MRKIAFSIFFVFIVMIGLHFVGTAPSTVGERVRDDADTARLEHMLYWSGLIDEYYNRMGQYPLQDWIQQNEEVVMVRILTSAQRIYSTKDSASYIAAADVDPEQFFPEVSMKDFVATLEAGLRHGIDEKYDIQQVPVTHPVGYYYFVSRDGYVLRGTCLRCGVTDITELLADGATPTISIASESMLAKVPKSKTRTMMLADPVFQKMSKVPYFKEGYVRAIERRHIHDSRQAPAVTQQPQAQ